MVNKGIHGLFCLALVLLMPPAAHAQEVTPCPPLVRQYGPYDYLSPVARARDLEKVERRHFTARVRSMHPRGETGSLMGDLEYTLNWFPNHHGALELLSRIAVREGSPTPLNASAPIECRFQWARQVNPGDETVPMIQGLYYHRIGRSAEGRQAMELAVAMAPENANARYNLGLVLLEMGDYEAAREQAREAYSLGYPLPGLRNLLDRAGYPLKD